jgi:hypothetical protein
MLVRFPGISGSTATIIATGEIDPYRPSYFCCDAQHAPHLTMW